ncbi:MAG: (2,3-dihydroxybenzoyl)adenylate synthase [Acidobacteria bacterium]|nr:MAG: (2,3-dihydroxybenzoyl)adenylate synthase [Acidobacteriota bacterium]
MLAGTVAWPAETAARYRREGYWDSTELFDIVRRGAARRPGQIALIDCDQRWTYADLHRDATRLAARLLALGLAPRDRVVMQLPNGAAFVLVYFALARIGAIPVMALRSHRQAELRLFLNASGATAYVIGDRAGSFDFRTMADALRAEGSPLRHVIVAGEPLPGQHALADLLRDGDIDEPPVTVDPAEVGTMLLSGGTTSMSKLIPRTHQDYVLNARLCGGAAGFDERTVFMAILPLGHNYNLASPGILGALTFGGAVVLSPSTDIDSVFATVQRERVTVIAAVVPMIAGWLEADVEQRFDLASLRVVQNGGARLAPELRQRLRERERLLHSSGAPVCDADEIVVVDDDGREVPDGEAGELMTRGPYTIRGYYDAAEKNADAFTEDGFYRMGDIVRRRGRYLYAEGRRKDFVNRGGEKISCEEIEALMLTHPKVKLAALVAMPDPVFGEKACAFVVPHPGETLGLAELIAFLRAQQIAAFKLPERLEIVAELPLSPVGKILKRELREIIAAKLAQEHPR